MRRGLPVRMLAGLLTGIVLGVAANLLAGDSPRLAGFIQYVTEPAGRIFLRLLFMLVIPLIVSALALGVAGLGDLRALGRIGLQDARLHRRRLGHRRAARRRAGQHAAPRRRPLPRASRRGWPSRPRPCRSPRTPGSASAAPTSSSQLVPSNIVKAMADGDMLAVMVFALLPRHRARGHAHRRGARLRAGARRASTTSTMRLLGIVIEVAPVGVACLLFTLTARLGLDVLRQLGAYVLVVLLGAGHPPVRRLLADGGLAGAHEPVALLPRRARARC